MSETRNLKERRRACVYCSKSKTRCIWPAGTEPGRRSCERCCRLTHVCELPELGDRRRRGPSTRVGQLEEKIDGLVTLLSVSRQLPPVTVEDLPMRSVSTTHEELVPMTPEFVLPCPEDVPGPIGIGSPKPAAPQFSLPAPPAEHVEVFPRFQVSMAEADSILQTYKEYHSVLFSFVPIPRMMSAYDLFLKKPFLFRTIMTVVAPQSTTIQKRATVWFREQIAEHMIVRQEKSLELLQALIISITWGEYHFYVAGQVTNLFQLAVALVMDLELNRPPRNAVFTSGSLVDEATRTSGMEGRRASHTLEDLRALLGCFYICSIVSTLFRRLTPFLTPAI